MKKTLITFALLLTVTVLNAQTLIEVNLKKGDKAVYEKCKHCQCSTAYGCWKSEH